MVSWALVVLILFPLLQVPAVLYLGKYCKLDPDEKPARPPVARFWDEQEDVEGPDRETVRREGPERAAHLVDDPDGIVCPECGTENGSGFRYCGSCAAALHAAD